GAAPRGGPGAAHCRRRAAGGLRPAGGAAGRAAGEEPVPEGLDAEPEAAHDADSRDCDRMLHSPRPRMSVTLCPPKPYDDVRATAMGARRPGVGTRSRSLHAGSGVRSVAVGGSREGSSASTVTTASTGP